MTKWIKWFFSSFGVVATDRPYKVLFETKKHIVTIKNPFRQYWPDGPNAQALTYYSFLHRKLSFFKCKVCSIGCWGYKQHTHCGRWKCYKEIAK